MKNGKKNSNLTNPRLKYLPQMYEYDHLGQDHELYSMFTQTKNFSGDYINTDNFGFRFSKFNDKYISVDTELQSNERINILIGGSTAFGVGVTHDDYTIASYLSKKSKERWINLGLRAGNSLQENINLLKIISKYPNIGKIAVLSGINDMYMNIAYNGSNNKLNDSIFNNSKIQNHLNTIRISNFSFKRRFASLIISLLINVKRSDIIHLGSISEMFKYRGRTDLNINSQKTSYVDQLRMTYERNFILYSGLQKALDKTQIYFFLQPYAGWVKKEINPKEKEIFDFLDLESNSFYEINKKIISGYNETLLLLKELSLKYGCNFYDMNVEYFGDKESFIFADRIHLTDKGSKFASEIIENHLYRK